jgi:hypothetical protein
MKQGELLAEQLDGSREWTLLLLADLECDDWAFQPGRGMAHALWLCGHLTGSQNTLIHARCLNRPILDSDFLSHFGIGVPVRSVQEHDYPSSDAILARMAEVHAQTLSVIRGMSDDFLDEPAYAADGKSYHPHYRDKRGAIGHCTRHESFHAGQLATIRRLLGKPFLR